jgi:hypothetical protein
MDAAKLANLESRFIPVESEYIQNLVYAVDRERTGMYLIWGNVKFPLDKINIPIFLTECSEISKLHLGV